ncbi:MAG: hypothetical protein QW757_00745 [Candidatus Woesearchaeota archaeon]
MQQKKLKKKSQISMEFLVIFGFVFLMIIPLILIYYDQLFYIKDEISENQIRNIMIKIADKSESIYFLGEPSQTTINVYFPENIEYINFTKNALIFNYRTSKNLLHSIYYPLSINITGNVSTKPGIKKIVIKNENNSIILNEK